MDIAEEGSLHFDVCSGQLTQKIGKCSTSMNVNLTRELTRVGDLAQPVFDEIKYSLGKKLDKDDKDSGMDHPA
jgi:hypothetical protein